MKLNKRTKLLLINKFHSYLQETKNTPNMNFNHLITPCKSFACSNTTTHYKANHKHHKYNAYKYCTTKKISISDSQSLSQQHKKSSLISSADGKKLSTSVGKSLVGNTILPIRSSLTLIFDRKKPS